MLFFWRTYEDSQLATAVSLVGSVGSLFGAFYFGGIIGKAIMNLFNIEAGNTILLVFTIIMMIVCFVILRILLNKLTDLIANKF